MKHVAVTVLFSLALVAGYRFYADAPTPPPARAATAVELAITSVDRHITHYTRRAAAHPTAWLELEQVAGAYLTRAALTGDFDDYRRADEALDEAFDRAPDGAGPFLTRAHLAFALHRLDDAAADLDRLSGTLLLGAERRRAIDELRGAIAFQRGAYDEARETYERLLAAERSVTILARLAHLEWKTGDAEAAHHFLVEAEQRAEDPQRLAWLAVVHGLMDFEHRAFNEALAHFTRGAQVFEGWYLPQLHVAEVLAKRGSLDAARIRYEALLKRTPNPEAMDALADVYASLDRPDDAARLVADARAAYEAQLVAFPEAAYGHAIDHYLRRGDAARAVELAEKNLALRPNAEARVKLARAYLLADREADAVTAIEAALESPASSYALHDTAARVFERAGDAERAADHRRRADAIGASVHSHG